VTDHISTKSVPEHDLVSVEIPMLLKAHRPVARVETLLSGRKCASCSAYGVE
jgi:hypothetical protein